jgi:hypothetical protein
MHYTLTNPPIAERARELWLQHAAGFIIFENIKKYAIDQISGDTDHKTKNY